MRSFVGYCCALALLLGLAGCAGTNFHKPSADALKIGETTYSQVILIMGQPRREGVSTKNEKQLKVISYSYATVGGEPLHDGVTPGRAQAFYFHNDTLVGHEFVSSFKDDNSDFDDSKVASIVKGKTSRAEVTQLIGKPSGAYIYPMIKAEKGDAAVYLFLETRGSGFTGIKFFRKLLVVSFDTAGVVSDVDYSSSGNK